MRDSEGLDRAMSKGFIVLVNDERVTSLEGDSKKLCLLPPANKNIVDCDQS